MRTISLAAPALAVLLGACPSDQKAADMAGPDLQRAGGTVSLQVLSISDWHGQLDPLSVSGADVGGAAVLSGYFKKERAAQPNTLLLTAGDEFGATPPLSAFNDDVPAVKALGLMGLAADTFGNHNFDSGLDRLQKLIDLASYKFTSANLDPLAGNLKGVPGPYYLVTVAGLKIALVGLTNDDAPALTRPGSMGTMKVLDAATSANAAAQKARSDGADLVIALVHMGATATMKVGADDVPIGPIMDFAKKVRGFDLILGDHTDFLVNTVVNDTPVVENRSFGRTYARIALTYDAGARRVTDRKVEIVTTYRCQPGGDMGCVPAVTPDADIEAMLMPYRKELNQKFDGKIGEATAVFERGMNVERLKEVPIGDLITDAMRQRYGVQIAIMNSGGIRAPIPAAYLPADKTLRRPSAGYAMGPPYDLVIGDVYTVLPFGNLAVTRTVTGKQLFAIMEHSVEALPMAAGAFLQVSGINVKFDSMKPAGMRVKSIALDDGTMVGQDDQTYTLVLGDFTNAGGDGYKMLADGTGTSREKLDQVLLDYIKQKGTLTPKTAGRLVDGP